MPIPSQAHATPRPVTLPTIVCVLAAVIAFGGCAQTASIVPSSAMPAGKDGKRQPVASQYPDIPIPKGVKRNIDKTMVVGTRTWFGQLSLESSYTADAMFDFYARELPNYGWRRITSVRAKTSVLTYDRQNRVMTIAIRQNRIRGSEVTITVSPRETSPPDAPRAGPAAPPPALGGGPGAQPPTMPPPVRRTQ